MALSAATLASELQSINAESSDEAASGLAAAFATYFAGASINGVVISSTATIEAAFYSSISTAMSSDEGDGWTKIADAVTAGWNTAWTSLPLLFIMLPNVPVPTTPPPGLAALSTTIQGIYTTNSGPPQQDFNSCMTNLANAIHASLLGSVVTVVLPLPSSPVISTII